MIRHRSRRLLPSTLPPPSLPPSARRFARRDPRRTPLAWATALLGAWLACAAPVGTAAAQTVGVATWNLNWLMDEPAHARWVAACAKLAWAKGASPEGLPYCDVHNGMAFPPEACASARDGWPLASRYPADHPCRDTADLATWPAYVRKLDALRAMFRRLEATGVRLVAVQEVFDAGAVRAILPPGWRVATTREQRGAPDIAQHVGVAWHESLRVRDVALEASLADSGLPSRPLRPGLAFTVDVGGKPVRALVVHLKAGCRSRDLDLPLTSKDAALPDDRRDAVISDCALLRYQLPALEGWIDANAAHDFAVLGDFNRTLLREPVAETERYRTRMDGTSAADPIGRCTVVREGSRSEVRCDVRTRAMFPEINDGSPPGAVLWRARFADMGRSGAIPKGTSGDCRIAGKRGALTHSGIDHVLVSDSLKQRLTAAALTMLAVNYETVDGQALAGGADVALPSDHCPHVVTWTPRR